MYTDAFEDDVDKILCSYWKKQGGYFIGNSEIGNYPHCQLILEDDTAPLVIGPVVISSTRYGYGMRCAARKQICLTQPFQMEILPMNLLRRGVELVAKKDIKIHDRDIDEKYLIKGDNSAFIKLFLPGSKLADLLLSTKNMSLSVSPVETGEKIHTIQVMCNKNVQEMSLGTSICEEDIDKMVRICRAAAEEMGRYPIEEQSDFK